MKKIERYLNKVNSLSKCSDSTVSKYYYIKHLEIRYSDHIKLPNKSDLQIIFPTCSDCDYYTVLYGNYSRIMILNAKQIIDLIPKLVAIKELSIIETCDSEYPTKLLQFTEEEKLKHASIISKTSNLWRKKEDYETLQTLIFNRYSTTKGYNGTFKSFLLTNSCTAIEALNLYYIVTKYSTGTINSYLLKKVLIHIRTYEK